MGLLRGRVRGDQRRRGDRHHGCSPFETGGVSVSVRDFLRREAIAFRLNDPGGVLPSPFPVFDTWTRFIEDEIVE